MRRILEINRSTGSGSSIRSDDRLVRGQFGGSARPSVGLTFSQEPASFRLEDSNEIPAADQRLMCGNQRVPTQISIS
jgi:hypothetical protein